MRRNKAILVNSHQTTLQQRFSSYSMLMALARSLYKTLARFPNQWDGVCNKVSLFQTLKYLIVSVEELLIDLDPNHDGNITEEEFALIFKYIQQRQQTSFPPIEEKKFTPNQSINTQQKSQTNATVAMYEADKKKYGALLPKTGVYFLPDEKVLGFLK